MRQILAITLILMFAVAGFAQQSQADRPEEPGSHGRENANTHKEEHDDHDHDGPVQAGFAIITPTGTTTGGTMTVFATFGMKHGGDVQPAGILPPGLTTNAIVFVSSSGRLSRNLGVAVVNPDGANANVTMTLRDDDGTQLGTKVITVAGHHATSQLVTELFTTETNRPRDINGTLSITSTTPIAITGLRFRGANFSTLPVTSLSTSTSSLPVFSTGIGGAGAILLPQFVAGGGWATEIVIANTGTAVLTVRLDLFKQDGTALTTRLNGTSGSSFTGLSVPVGGVLMIAPRDNHGDSDF
jgi:hypothetical protein